MHGPDVAEVQRLLGISDDGVFGPVTARAVAGWQRARGAEAASGELDPLEQPGLVALRRRPLREVRAFARDL